MNNATIVSKREEFVSGAEVRLTGWQRQTVIAAVAFIRERCGNPPADPKTRATHEALLEMLDPRRRALRLQRELGLVPASDAGHVKSERRERADRRRAGDRRCWDFGPRGPVERRRGERRKADDRREL
jgi:hypothetical protein